MPKGTVLACLARYIKKSRTGREGRRRARPRDLALPGIDKRGTRERQERDKRGTREGQERDKRERDLEMAHRNKNVPDNSGCMSNMCDLFVIVSPQHHPINRLHTTRVRQKHFKD